eukprot:1845653-Pyramimonas_sp.AAC.1
MALTGAGHRYSGHGRHLRYTSFDIVALSRLAPETIAPVFWFSSWAVFGAGYVKPRTSTALRGSWARARTGTPTRCHRPHHPTSNGRLDPPPELRARAALRIAR